MSRFLSIDVGAGTMDVLWYDDETDEYFKSVVVSPVRLLAQKVNELEGDLLVTGREMGGGPVSRTLAERAKSCTVVMTRSAAATIHHDLDRVRLSGIEIISDDETNSINKYNSFKRIHLGDIDAERLRLIVEGFGVPFAFDVVGVCVQDHGVPTSGVSHLEHRHIILSRRLDESARVHDMLYAPSEIPATFNRLRSAAADATALPAKEVYVMDSSMAAMLGAGLDQRCRAARFVLVLDVATSHTVGATFDGDELCGFFEYHTRDITVERLDSLIVDLAEGRIAHERILERGGHGAYLRRPVGFDNVEVITATGPNRKLVTGSTLSIQFGAPLGDNMMTGTAGLLEAVRRRKGLSWIATV